MQLSITTLSNNSNFRFWKFDAESLLRTKEITTKSLSECLNEAGVNNVISIFKYFLYNRHTSYENILLFSHFLKRDINIITKQDIRELIDILWWNMECYYEAIRFFLWNNLKISDIKWLFDYWTNWIQQKLWIFHLENVLWHKIETSLLIEHILELSNILWRDIKEYFLDSLEKIGIKSKQEMINFWVVRFEKHFWRKIITWYLQKFWKRLEKWWVNWLIFKLLMDDIFKWEDSTKLNRWNIRH